MKTRNVKTNKEMIIAMKMIVDSGSLEPEANIGEYTPEKFMAFLTDYLVCRTGNGKGNCTVYATSKDGRQVQISLRDQETMYRGSYETVIRLYKLKDGDVAVPMNRVLEAKNTELKFSIGPDITVDIMDRIQHILDTAKKIQALLDEYDRMEGLDEETYKKVVQCYHRVNTAMSKFRMMNNIDPEYVERTEKTPNGELHIRLKDGKLEVSYGSFQQTFEFGGLHENLWKAIVNYMIKEETK